MLFLHDEDVETMPLSKKYCGMYFIFEKTNGDVRTVHDRSNNTAAKYLSWKWKFIVEAVSIRDLLISVDFKIKHTST